MGVQADSKYRWETFDNLMSDLDDVRGAFSEGANLVGVRLGEQLAAAGLASAHGVRHVAGEPVATEILESRRVVETGQ